MTLNLIPRDTTENRFDAVIIFHEHLTTDNVRCFINSYLNFVRFAAAVSILLVCRLMTEKTIDRWRADRCYLIMNSALFILIGGNGERDAAHRGKKKLCASIWWEILRRWNRHDKSSSHPFICAWTLFICDFSLASVSRAPRQFRSRVMRFAKADYAECMGLLGGKVSMRSFIYSQFDSAEELPCSAETKFRRAGWSFKCWKYLWPQLQKQLKVKCISSSIRKCFYRWTICTYRALVHF